MSLDSFEHFDHVNIDFIFEYHSLEILGASQALRSEEAYHLVGHRSQVEVRIRLEGWVVEKTQQAFD